MKRFFMLFMAVIMSAFLLAGCGLDSDQTDQATITELQATVDDLQNQVEEYSALKTELDSANNSIAELQSEIDALKTEKEEMSSKLEILYKIEPLDETVYYTTSEAKVYDDLYGEILGMEPVGTIPAEQEVKVIGKSAVTDWLVLKTDDGSTQMVSGSLVSRDKPVQQSKPSGNTGTGGGSSQQPSGGGSTGGGNGGGSTGGGSSQPSGDDGTGVGGGALSGLGLQEAGGQGSGGGSGLNWTTD